MNRTPIYVSRDSDETALQVLFSDGSIEILDYKEKMQAEKFYWLFLHGRLNARSLTQKYCETNSINYKFFCEGESSKREISY